MLNITQNKTKQNQPTKKKKNKKKKSLGTDTAMLVDGETQQTIYIFFFSSLVIFF